jgi:tetratricopeptide (TPR) repeat protein
VVVISFVFPTLIGSVYTVVGQRTYVLAHNSIDIERAISYLHVAQIWTPREPEPYRYAARAEINLGRYDAAVANLEAAYQLRPTSLLIQQELAVAYELAGRSKDSSSLWTKLGISKEQAILVGDHYLRAGAYREAWGAYRRLTDDSAILDTEHLFRIAVVAAINQVAEATELLGELERRETGFTVKHVTNGELVFDGSELHWLIPPSSIPIGAPLTFGAGETTFGYMWGDGQALGIIGIKESGRYELGVQVMHAPPAPILLVIGIDGRQIKRLELTRGDYSSEIITLPIDLTIGWHSLNFWYLNDAIIDGGDRNAVIERIKLRRLS